VSKRTDGLDTDPSEREFTIRLLEALIRHLDRLQAAVGKDIRFDVPLIEQFDADTLAALEKVWDDDDESLPGPKPCSTKRSDCKMHIQSEKALRVLARQFIDECNDIGDARTLFRDEARARYVAEDDGDFEQYWADAADVFNEEVSMTAA
jgi:hypothetical protein